MGLIWLRPWRRAENKFYNKWIKPDVECSSVATTISLIITDHGYTYTTHLLRDIYKVYCGVFPPIIHNGWLPTEAIWTYITLTLLNAVGGLTKYDETWEINEQSQTNEENHVWYE